MSRRAILKITIALCTILVCLLMLEGFARIAIGRGTMHLGVEMWKYAKDVKLRSPNPEIGHRHRPNAHRFLMGVDVQTDSLGLRDVERSLEKPAGTERIVVLGDSITFGWGVPFESTFCHLLEKSLNANPPVPGRTFEVVNTGVGNSNTAMEVAYLKEEGWKLQPDLILVGWFINDAEPTPKPSENWFAYHSYAFVWLDSAIDGVMRNTKARQSYTDYYRGLYDDAQPGWPKCRRAFAELAAFCEKHKVPCRILLIPELHTIGPGYEFKDIHDEIRALCAQVKLPTLELLDAFPELGDPHQYWVCPGDAHPNARGNELMAAKIDRALREGKWLP